MPPVQNAPFCNSENTVAYQKHEAFADSLSFYNSYMGSDCVDWFCIELFKIYEKVRSIYEFIIPMDLTVKKRHLTMPKSATFVPKNLWCSTMGWKRAK